METTELELTQMFKSIGEIPVEAAKQANRITDPANRGQVEARREVIKAKVKKNPKFYSRRVAGHFSSATDIERGVMTNEYEDLFNAYFESGLNETEAQDLALDKLDNNWSFSEIAGDKMIRHAPDKFYTSVNPSVIRDDFVSAVKDAEGTFGFFTTNEDSRYELVSDTKTDAEARSGFPSYRVRVITDGQLFDIPGFRYRPAIKEMENAKRDKIRNIAKKIESESLNQQTFDFREAQRLEEEGSF